MAPARPQRSSSEKLPRWSDSRARHWACSVLPGCSDGLHAPRGAATHQSRMTAMLAGQRLDDGARFAMRPRGKHDGIVVPFHARTHSSGIFQPDRAVMLAVSAQFSRTFTNRNRCTRRPKMSSSLVPRRFADRFHRWPPLPSTIAFWPSRFDIDHLVDADRSVFLLRPFFGFDGRRVGQSRRAGADRASRA